MSFCLRTVLAVSAAAFLPACGGDGGEAPPAGVAPMRGGGTQTALDGGRTDSGGGGSTGGTPDAGDAGVDDSVPPTDELELVDEADTDCSQMAGEPMPVYAPGEGPGVDAFTHLGLVGTRWWAGDRDSRGVVWFDRDGGNASDELLSLGSLNEAAGSSSYVGIASASFTIEYSRFSETGEPIGSVTQIAEEEALGLALGRGGGRALVVWSTGTRVRARAVVDDGSLPARAFDLEASGSTEFDAAVAHHDESGFAVVWSVRRSADLRYRTYFARTSDEALVGPTRPLLVTSAPHRVVELLSTESGFAVLLDIDGTAVVARLDALGRPIGPARRLLGTATGLAIASHADQIGVIAVREDGAVGFRAFDASGSKTGWLCVAHPPPGEPRGASIGSDPLGFAILARSNTGGQELRLLDPLGTPR